MTPAQGPERTLRPFSGQSQRRAATSPTMNEELGPVEDRGSRTRQEVNDGIQGCLSGDENRRQALGQRWRPIEVGLPAPQAAAMRPPWRSRLAVLARRRFRRLPAAAPPERGAAAAALGPSSLRNAGSGARRQARPALRSSSALLSSLEKSQPPLRLLSASPANLTVSHQAKTGGTDGIQGRISGDEDSRQGIEKRAQPLAQAVPQAPYPGCPTPVQAPAQLTFVGRFWRSPLQPSGDPVQRGVTAFGRSGP